MTPLKAITFGRYSPYTVAHLHTAEQIAANFDEIVLGVIDDAGQYRVGRRTPLTDKFYKLADAQNNKTVFSLKERLTMARLAVKDVRLQDKVSITSLKRPEYNIEEFNARFPADTYQIVFPKPVDELIPPEFDRIRSQALSSLLSRSVVTVPTYLTIHCSEVKNKSIDVPGIWKEYMTPGVYKYFKSINGPARLLAADSYATAA